MIFLNSGLDMIYGNCNFVTRRQKNKIHNDNVFNMTILYIRIYLNVYLPCRFGTNRVTVIRCRVSIVCIVYYINRKTDKMRVLDEVESVQRSYDHTRSVYTVFTLRRWSLRLPARLFLAVSLRHYPSLLVSLRPSFDIVIKRGMFWRCLLLDSTASAAAVASIYYIVEACLSLSFTNAPCTYN